MNTFDKRLALKALAVSTVLALALLLGGSWILSWQSDSGSDQPLPGANTMPFAPIPRQDLEQVYHQAWLKVPQEALDQTRFADWAQWEHKFDGKIRTEAQLKEAIAAMLASLGDRYMVVLTNGELVAFEQAASGKYVGIGINLAGRQISSLIPDGPALKAGLQPGDTIVAVDGYTIDDTVSTAKMMVRLRGNGLEGSKLYLVVLRDHKRITFELKREVIRRDPAVTSYIGGESSFFGFGGGFGGQAAPSTAQPGGQPKPGMFFPRPAAFQKDTTAGVRIYNLRSETVDSELLAELEKMDNEKMEGIVLDLRGLKGGSALTAAKVAALFLPDGKLVNAVERIDGVEVAISYAIRSGKLTVTTTRPGRQPVEQVLDAPVNRYAKKPVFVLVDETTTGAAELVAAALKENQRATIFGANTAGKASGQRTVTLSQNYVVRVTVSRYLSPSGKPLDGIGVKPDALADVEAGNSYGQAMLALREQIEKNRPKAEEKPNGGGDAASNGEAKPAGDAAAPKGDSKPADGSDAGQGKPDGGNAPKGESK